MAPLGRGVHVQGATMNPANVYSSGRLVREDARSGFTIFVGPDLKPGDGCRGEIDIANLGALPGTLLLSELDSSNGFVAGRLALAIDELHGTSHRRVFLGEIGAMPAGGIDLGRFEAGESRTYRFTVLLKKDAPKGERESASATYIWSATAVPV
jgi:hypothetical protein